MISCWLHRLSLSALMFATGLAATGCVADTQDDLRPQDVPFGQASQDIAGPTTTASAYPEAVLLDGVLETDPTHIRICSGVLIAPRVVLTAGHCVIGISEWRVVAPNAAGQTAASVKGNRFDYTDLGATLNPNQHDIGLVYLDRDILTSYPVVSTIPFTTSPIFDIGRINNGALSFSNLFVSQPVTITSGAAVGFPFTYASSPSLIESGDSGGPDILVSASPHILLAVNSTRQLLTRVDLLASWIQERASAQSCGPTCANPIEQSAFFVRQMYLDVLGREPDTAGQAFQLNILTSCNGDAACLASARVAVARGMFDSPENRAQYPELDPSSANYNAFFVKHCYWSFLGRQPDTGGFNFFMNVLASTGNDYNAVIRSFITSAEFRARFGGP